MSNIIIVEINENGKIELTREELQRMLDNAYNRGYSEGYSTIKTTAVPSFPWAYYISNQTTAKTESSMCEG